MTELEALEAQLDAGVTGALGDTITYLAQGGVAKSIAAFVDHSDMADNMAGTGMVKQDIEIEVEKTDVPTLAKTDVFTLPRTGKTYNPVEWRNSRSGRQWLVRLKIDR